MTALLFGTLGRVQAPLIVFDFVRHRVFRGTEPAATEVLEAMAQSDIETSTALTPAPA